MTQGVILEADLSQVESRLVYAYSKDPALIEAARTPPTERDDHKEVAALMFGVSVKEVTKDQRNLSKTVSHAAQRSMGAKKLQEKFLLAGVQKPLLECKWLLDKYYAARPGIQVYMRLVRQQIMSTRSLTNSWGRKITWTYHRLDDELYRKAYSWWPQSEDSDLMLQWGVIPAWKYIKSGAVRAVLHTTVHDSVVFSVHPVDAYTLAVFLRDSLERVRTYDGVDLSIPVEFKLGSTWACEVEFKGFPSREEFQAGVEKIQKIQQQKGEQRNG